MTKVVPVHSVPSCEYELTHEQWQQLAANTAADTPVTKRLRAKKHEQFALGPIPTRCQNACFTADPVGLHLAMGIIAHQKRRIDHPLQKWVVVGDILGGSLGLSRYQHHHAVDALETAGLVEVERKPNHAPRVKLIPWRAEKG